MDINKLAEDIIRYIGGQENVSGLTHCATRLRFILKDESIVKENEIKSTQGVLGIAKSGGQFQIIIGNKVPKVYAAIEQRIQISGGQDGNGAKQQKPVEKLFDFVASVFTPVLPAIIGAGLIKSILSLAVLLGMNAEGTTYLFLNTIGDAPLYFLPMLLAVTVSKKLNCNTFLAVAITGALLHPNYTALITDAFNIHFSSVFGIPVTLASYNSSVIPVLLMVIALKYVEQFLDKVIPNMIKFFFKPVLTMLIVGLLTFIVLGPIGFVTGVAISTALNTLSVYAGWLVPMIIGGIFPLMVTTGMHYGIVPFMLQSIAAVGYEQICCPGNLPSNIAQGAASLSVALKTKKSEEKQLAMTSGFTALLGVTEPALFGVTLKYKKVLACVMAGGACGGLYAGLTSVKCFSFCTPGLLSLVAFVGPDGWSNLINACISMVIGFVVTFVLVFVWGSRDLLDEEETAGAGNINAGENTESAVSGKMDSADRTAQNISMSATVKEEIIVSPAAGEIVSLSEVPDETFAGKLLGDGAAIRLTENSIFSPVDGTVDSIFPTGHAIGLTSYKGAEILIHVGIDTVNLQGKYFHVAVKPGQKVKKGDLLLTCELDRIQAEGYETITPVVISNTDEYQNIRIIQEGPVTAGTDIIGLNREETV